MMALGIEELTVRGTVRRVSYERDDAQRNALSCGGREKLFQQPVQVGPVRMKPNHLVVQCREVVQNVLFVMEADSGVVAN